jgi:uncharacterized protein HemY
LRRAQAPLAPILAPLRERVAGEPPEHGRGLAHAIRCIVCKQHDEARTQLRYLLAHDADPSHRAILHYDLGLVAARERRYGEARRSFERALALDPEPVRIWDALARALVRLGRADEARARLARERARRVERGASAAPFEALLTAIDGPPED